MTIFNPSDVGRHVPPAGSKTMHRESWWLQWHDVESDSAGVVCSHIDDGDTPGHAGQTAPRQPRVRVSTMLYLDGEAATHVASPALAEQAVDGSDGSDGSDGFDSAGLHIATIDPLRSFALAAPGGVNLRFESSIDPIRFSLSGQRIALDRDFYESVGTVTGRVQHGDRTIEIAAPAFHRHAWGALTNGVHRVQVARAAFGDDMFFSFAEYDSPTGRHPLGYLFAAEEFHGVEKVRFRTELDHRGAVTSCDLLVATADRRDFRIPGSVVSDTGPGLPAFVSFQLAGRRATGVLAARAN